MVKRILILACLCLAFFAATASATGDAPGTFMRDDAGGYFDTCHVVRVVPLEQKFRGTPTVQVALDTGDQVGVSPYEGSVDEVVANIAGTLC